MAEPCAWTLQPGNDFFLSFNQGWIQDELDNRRMQFRVQDTRVSTKFSTRTGSECAPTCCP